jgi:hypothetical protein
MLAVDIKKMNIMELEELLLLNTKEMSINYEIMTDGFANTLAAYIEGDDILKEETTFWHNALMTLYGFEDRIVDALADTMGAFRYVLWCRDHLQTKKEVALYVEMYQKYRGQKLSTANLLSTILDLLIQGLADSDPESIASLMGQLENQLNRLPEFIKSDLDLDGTK